jgi:hypothetical protein
MATQLGGTTANNVLTSLQFAPTGTATSIADIATLANAIYDDRQNVYPNPTIPGGTVIVQPSTPIVYPGAFGPNGLLYVPNRGVLKVLPGDYVMVDTTSGWPILVSRTAIGIGSSLWHSA